MNGYRTVADFEREAEQLLDPVVHAYYAGGAGEELTLAENREAFRRRHLRPRALVDVSSVTAATTVLGTEVACPVLLAPVGFQGLAQADAELAVARAAAAARTIYCLPTLSSIAPAECTAAVPGGERWFQLYWSRDRGFTRELLARVAGGGFSALMLTVDLPVFPLRDRELRAGFRFPEEMPLPNVAPELLPLGTGLGHMVDATLTWRDLEWLREAAPLPLVVKGILTAEDALVAAEHGVEAIVVSNHGGRQLDGVQASLDALPEVVDAVGERIEVLMDGGVRRGGDVLKALALGARAVLIGRAFVWALAVAGEEGVSAVLESFEREIAAGLALLGCRSPAELTRSHIGP